MPLSLWKASRPLAAEPLEPEHGVGVGALQDAASPSLSSDCIVSCAGCHSTPLPVLL